MLKRLSMYTDCCISSLIVNSSKVCLRPLFIHIKHVTFSGLYAKQIHRCVHIPLSHIFYVFLLWILLLPFTREHQNQDYTEHMHDRIMGNSSMSFRNLEWVASILRREWRLVPMVTDWMTQGLWLNSGISAPVGECVRYPAQPTVSPDKCWLYWTLSSHVLQSAMPTLLLYTSPWQLCSENESQRKFLSGSGVRKRETALCGYR